MKFKIIAFIYCRMSRKLNFYAVSFRTASFSSEAEYRLLFFGCLRLHACISMPHGLVVRSPHCFLAQLCDIEFYCKSAFVLTALSSLRSYAILYVLYAACGCNE